MHLRNKYSNLLLAVSGLAKKKKKNRSNENELQSYRGP